MRIGLEQQQAGRSSPARRRHAAGNAAESDEALLKSWLRSLNSPHTQRNFEATAKRFLAELPAASRDRRGRPRCPHQHERRAIGGLGAPVRAPHQVIARLRPRARLHALQCWRDDQGAVECRQPRRHPGQAHHLGGRGDTPSIAAHPCQRFRPPWVTATSPPPVAICMPVPTHRTAFIRSWGIPSMRIRISV
jgi:hypothetical protein